MGRECGTDDGVTFHFHVPVSNLRLVSRQFTAEYDERYKTLSSKKSILSIVINSRNNCRIWYSVCPQLAFRCRESSTTRTLLDGSDEYTETALRDVLKKSISHFHNTTILAKCMPHFYRVNMRLDFESLHQSGYPGDLLPLFQKLTFSKSWPTDGKFELHYQGLTYPQPDKLRELNVPNIDILDSPITLATWNPAS